MPPRVPVQDAYQREYRTRSTITGVDEFRSSWLCRGFGISVEMVRLIPWARVRVCVRATVTQWSWGIVSQKAGAQPVR